MECCFCGAPLTEQDYCPSCRSNVRQYKRIIYTANRLYNEGIDRANVRDLTGAIQSLRQALKCNKGHTQARNLLGLVYYETGEVTRAFSEWYISQRLSPENNPASGYMEMVSADPGKVEALQGTIKKFNIALDYSRKGDVDLAIIQLKQVLRQNRRFVKAHQLLALLLMNKGEWDRAAREVEQCIRIDNGNLMTLRYMREIEKRLQASEDAGKHKKKEEPSRIPEYRVAGTDPLLLPMGRKESLGVNAFLHIAVGMVIGVLVALFLILPSREDTIRVAAEQDKVVLNEQIEARNMEISTLNSRLAEMETKNNELQSELTSYTGEGGVLSVYDQLATAAAAYLDKDQDKLAVEESLNSIPEEFIDGDASKAYTDLYVHLRTAVGDSVAQSYYEDGIAAYRSSDYTAAIENLTKAYNYDKENDDALYYLGLAYFDSGDKTKAAECFEELIEKFPDSSQIKKANQRLKEING